MNKKFILILIIFVSILGVLTKPTHASALTLGFENSISKINIGDSVLVKVFVNTDGKEINTLEGTLKVNGQAKISSINTGGSIFDLWPEKPQIINNQEISFTGGTEGGVYGKDLRVFNFTITPTTDGVITLEPVLLFGYLNDGTGTKLSGNNTSFNITVVKQQENITENTNNNLVAEDKIQPAPFTIDLGSDQYLFGGKYFISFYTTDADSGINRYEVKEGSSAFETSDNTYVLKDQTLKSKISVKAIDNAGNERVEVLNSGIHTPLIWKILEIILIVFAVILLIYFVYKISQKRKNAKYNQ